MNPQPAVSTQPAGSVAWAGPQGATGPELAVQRAAYYLVAQAPAPDLPQIAKVTKLLRGVRFESTVERERHGSGRLDTQALLRSELTGSDEPLFRKANRIPAVGCRFSVPILVDTSWSLRSRWPSAVAVVSTLVEACRRTGNRSSVIGFSQVTCSDEPEPARWGQSFPLSLKSTRVDLTAALRSTETLLRSVREGVAFVALVGGMPAGEPLRRIQALERRGVDVLLSGFSDDLPRVLGDFLRQVEKEFARDLGERR